MQQAWREPRTCGECSEFLHGRRALLAGVEAPGWCVQCAGPVRPEAPACPVFSEAPRGPEGLGSCKDTAKGQTWP